MKLINFNQPYLLFWVSILLIWLATLLVPAETIKILIYEIYLVIAYYHGAIFLTILLAGIGLLYWLFRKRELIRWMTIFHVLITILPILVLSIWYGFSIEDRGGAYVEGEVIDKSLFYLLYLLAFIFGQILFVLNLLMALFKK